MDTLDAILLGLVQGLTEFLPVSSSGHLVLAQELLGAGEEGVLFEIVLHVATLGSVLIFYRKRVAELILGVLRRQTEAWDYVGKLIVATLPVVLLVLVAGDFLQAQFESPRAAAFGLLATGAILWTTRRTLPSASAPMPSYPAALLIGCAQAFAILPGISRSGSTVAAALALGVAPVAAAEFSFMLSIVAITGAAVRVLADLPDVSAVLTTPVLIGGAVSLISGIGAIWAFLRLLQSQSFHKFAYYLWPAGLLALALL